MLPLYTQMAESYTLVLNTAISTNRTGSADNSTYSINWDSFLPPGVSRFALTVSIRTLLTATVLNSTAVVYLDGLGLYAIDQTGARTSACLSIIPATNGAPTTVVYAYQSLYSDDNSIMVDRPSSNNKITVRWATLPGGPMVSIPDNICYLNFTPI